MPKLATAYNYLLSDLPVFRFFCDLQNQGIHKNLYLRLRDRIQGLTYYPRVQFRNVILSPASWKLSREHLPKQAAEAASCTLKQYLNERSVPQYFKVGSGDQTLFFDAENRCDMEALYLLLSKEHHLYVEEAFLPKKSLVKDVRDQPYLSQFQLSLYHNRQVYHGLTAPLFESDPTQIFLPGQEWLYFEIFCHPLRTDYLLTEVIGNFLSAHHQLIDKWFFIRYNEQGDHLRLRIRLKQPQNGLALITAFSMCLNEMMIAGTIFDLVLKSYKRETQRYGLTNINSVERHFCIDSQFVLQLLATDCSDHQKYQQCLELITAIEAAALFDQKGFLAMIENNSNLFNQEHQLSPAQFKLLNTESKAIEKFNGKALPYQCEVSYNAFVASFIDLLQLYQPQERSFIFGSLLHMHINRLFPTAPRMHETIIYYMRNKMQQRAMATINGPKQSSLT